MKKNQSSRSGLLLMEIIIAILFFSVVSAVCLQLFVKAHNLSEDTGELDMAVREASSVAELIGQSETPLKKVEEMYRASVKNAGKLSIYYDKSFMACGDEESPYRLDITSDKTDDRTVTYHVVIYAAEKNEEIYRLDTVVYDKHIPKA